MVNLSGALVEGLCMKSLKLRTHRLSLLRVHQAQLEERPGHKLYLLSSACDQSTSQSVTPKEKRQGGDNNLVADCLGWSSVGHWPRSAEGQGHW